MDVSSLSLTSMISNYKPFHCLLPPSKIHQKLPRQYVSCQARKKLANEVEETAINNDTQNFYKMLSLSSKNASMDEIRRAYRSMALRYHPDVCHDPLRKEESTRMFLQLHAAYETLSNPVLREEYDYELGLIRSRRSNNNVGGGEKWRRRWEEQVVELKRRSNRRMAQKEGSSWGSRIRAQNIEKINQK